MTTFQSTELEVVRWGEARGIVAHGKPLGQAIKTLEEVTELIDAINRNHMTDIKDAVGDIMVTLVMVCATLDISLTNCFVSAHDQIKGRKGYLRATGVFVKDEA